MHMGRTSCASSTKFDFASGRLPDRLGVPLCRHRVACRPPMHTPESLRSAAIEGDARKPASEHMSLVHGVNVTDRRDETRHASLTIARCIERIMQTKLYAAAAQGTLLSSWQGVHVGFDHRGGMVGG